MTTRLPENNCSVYLIHSTSGHIKIGHSNNPKGRLAQLQTTSGPFEYELSYYWVCSTRDEARFIERWLHNIYDEKRVNGEWFNLSPQDLVDIGWNCFSCARQEYEKSL